MMFTLSTVVGIYGDTRIDAAPDTTGYAIVNVGEGGSSLALVFKDVGGCDLMLAAVARARLHFAPVEDTTLGGQCPEDGCTGRAEGTHLSVDGIQEAICTAGCGWVA